MRKTLRPIQNFYKDLGIWYQMFRLKLSIACGVLIVGLVIICPAIRDFCSTIYYLFNRKPPDNDETMYNQKMCKDSLF